MQRNTLFLFVCAISVVSVALLSGCISNPFSGTDKIISELTTGESLALNTYEVSRLNYSAVKPLVENKGYEWKNDSGGNTVSYAAAVKEPNISYDVLTIRIWWNTTSNESFIRGIYSPDHPFPESNLSEKKQWLKDRVDEIATICNLTVNWAQVKWSITYAD